MRTNKLKMLAIIAFLGISFASCNNDDPQTTTDTSITSIAVSNPNLSVLVQALTRANLAATLKTTGPFTVFAPTNTAFNAFLTANGYVTNGVPDVNLVPVDALTEVLKNHVVSGSLQASALVNNSYIKTLAKGAASTTNTLSMFVSSTTAGVKLNGISNVITTTAGTTFNIIASNGVIHTVDKVIGLPTIVTHATANSNFSILATLLTNQNLIAPLSGTSSSPFTVFAPLNSAFDTATLALYNGLDTSDKKTAVLKYHVITGANVLSNAIPTTPIPTFESGTVTVSGTVITDEKNRQINIVLKDVQCANGIIHAVDKVLLPNSVP